MNTQPEALRLADALTAEPDCTCHAVSYCECSCDAIWPEQWVDHAAAELRRLFKTGLEVADRADGLRCENELLKAQRKPLTDEEIQAIWAKTFEWGSSANTFARAIEQAHGIGGEDDNADH